MFVKVNEADKTVELIEGPSPKKITATRLAGVLGKDPYKSEFAVWADITGVYKKRFDGNKFIRAGEILEPKIKAWLRKKDNRCCELSEFFGKRVKDIDAEDGVLGGIPDFLKVEGGTQAEGGKIIEVIEIKTFSNFEKWAYGPPEHYKIQNADYGALSGVDNCRLIGLYVGDLDLDNIEEVMRFEVTDKNIIDYPFSISKDFPEIFQYQSLAKQWYQKHVIGGISPKFNDGADWEIVQSLRDYMQGFRTEALKADMARLEYLLQRKEIISQILGEEEKEIKKLKAKLKPAKAQGLIPGVFGYMTMSIVEGSTERVDKDKLRADGLFDTYMKVSKSQKFETGFNPIDMDVEFISGYKITGDGEVFKKRIKRINGSLAAGTFAELQGPCAYMETHNFILCYKELSDTSKGRVFHLFDLMQVFDAVLVCRKDLQPMDEDDLGLFMQEFIEIYQPPCYASANENVEDYESICEGIEDTGVFSE